MRLWGRTRDQMGTEAREIFAAEPEQDAAMGIAIDAWRKVSTCRQTGMSPGEVPWWAFERWCQRRRIDDDVCELLWVVIKRLDVEEMERWAFEARRRG